MKSLVKVIALTASLFLVCEANIMAGPQKEAPEKPTPEKSERPTVEKVTKEVNEKTSPARSNDNPKVAEPKVPQRDKTDR